MRLARKAEAIGDIATASKCLEKALEAKTLASPTENDLVFPTLDELLGDDDDYQQELEHEKASQG